MPNLRHSGKVQLGLFSLGVSVPLYFFMQYLFTPICWWLAQRIDGLAWMNDIFLFFELVDRELFSQKELLYSVLGIAAFAFSYRFLPKELVRFNPVMMQKDWLIPRAERTFWFLFLIGFVWKLVKLFMGLDLSTFWAPVSMFGNVYVAFLLQLNWYHSIALVVINVAYQEAKTSNHPSMPRLRILSYATNIFVILVSLTTGSDTSTIFPMFNMIIVRQFYAPIPFSKIAIRVVIGVCMIFMVKEIVTHYTQGDDADSEAGDTALFSLFFVLFFRVNMTHVLTAVIESGRQAFPQGTLSQFWVEMQPYGVKHVNTFDGNEFGRALGLAQQEDFSTGIAVTNIGDFYLNFGLMGIIGGMLLCGVFYKSLVSSCSERRPTFIFVYALMWPMLIHGMESPITILFATCLKMLAMCTVVNYILTYGSSIAQVETVLSDRIPGGQPKLSSQGLTP